MIDAQRGLDRALDPLLKHLPEVRRPTIAVLNKIDLVAKPDLLRLAADLSAHQAFRPGLHGLGADRRRRRRPQVLSRRSRAARALALPRRPADRRLARQTAAEITREKLFLRLHEELPYTLTVETTDWKELADGTIRIEQTIYVERESQRKIVLGAKGQTIKEIGTAARAEIGEMAGVPVHLFLFVKVRERWADDPERYREMGLDYPKR